MAYLDFTRLHLASTRRYSLSFGLLPQPLRHCSHGAAQARLRGLRATFPFRQHATNAESTLAFMWSDPGDHSAHEWLSSPSFLRHFSIPNASQTAAEISKPPSKGLAWGKSWPRSTQAPRTPAPHPPTSSA